MISKYMTNGNTMTINNLRAVSHLNIKTLPEVITALDVTLLDACKALLVACYMQQNIPCVATGDTISLDLAIIQV